MEDAVQSGSDLTKQLLGFAGTGKMPVQSADLTLLIKKCTKMFAFTKNKIRIYENYEQSLWPALIDSAQIEQVLINLFINAWQAMTGSGDSSM